MAYTKRLMAERIAFHTGQTVEQIEADSDRDRWFTAERGQGLRHHRPRDPARGEIELSAAPHEPSAISVGDRPVLLSSTPQLSRVRSRPLCRLRSRGEVAGMVAKRLFHRGAPDRCRAVSIVA